MATLVLAVEGVAVQGNRWGPVAKPMVTKATT